MRFWKKLEWLGESTPYRLPCPRRPPKSSSASKFVGRLPSYTPPTSENSAFAASARNQLSTVNMPGSSSQHYRDVSHPAKPPPLCAAHQDSTNPSSSSSMRRSAEDVLKYLVQRSAPAATAALAAHSIIPTKESTLSAHRYEPTNTLETGAQPGECVGKNQPAALNAVRIAKHIGCRCHK